MAQSPTRFDIRRVAANSWLISVAIHTLCLLVLAFIVFPRLTIGDGRTVRLRLGEFSSESMQEFDLAPPIDVSAASESSTNSLDQSIQQAETALDDQPLIVPPTLATTTVANVLAKPTPSTVRSTDGSARTPSINQASGVSAALKGVTDAIRQELTGGDVLVAWLFDSSTSLKEHRKQMAGKAEQFFAELESDTRAKTGHYGRLSNVVVAFGRRSRVIQKPSDDMKQAIHAMRRLPVDTTGSENVMASIQDVVKRYRKRSVGPERMLIVILTDESGDDVGALENTIEQCQNYEVPVHVLGPTSAFGLHRTSQIISGQYIATVMKGPESAQQERFHAGFWYEDDFPKRGRNVNAFPWFGGNHRECVPAGFGTFALTRLTQQTSGTYTIFDREGTDPTLGNYDLERMRPYLPSYQSQAEYLKAARKSQLRSFVLASSDLSHESRFAPPPPHRWSANPRRPGESVDIILRRQKIALADTQRSITALLSQYRNVDWASQLDAEPDLRWKAWFNLNRGRMLAYSVRIAEYLAANESIKPSTWARARQVQWRPSEQYRQPSSPLLAKQAMEHLNRCIQDHAGTPWAALAQWELDHAFGTRVGVTP